LVNLKHPVVLPRETLLPLQLKLLTQMVCLHILCFYSLTRRCLIDGLVYDDGADDVEEDEYLYVEGESPPEEDDGTDIPVRLLSDFTVYNADTFRVIPVAELLQLSFSEDDYQASGLVKAWADDSEIPSDMSDNDVSDNGDGEGGPREGSERVTLSKILEFSIHNKSEAVDGLDRCVLVRLPTCRDCSTSRTL